MKVLLPPLLFTIGALGGGRWLGSQSVTGSAAQSARAASLTATAESNPLPATGLARRAALLKKLEHPCVADIQRLIESGAVHGHDVTGLAVHWAKQDPPGLWRWLNEGGKKRLGNIDMSYLVFSEWFSADPDAAIAAYRSLSFGDGLSAASGFLFHLFSANETLRQKLLPLLDELAIGGAGPPWGSDKEPDLAAKLLALPASAGRDTLLDQTGRAWLDRDWQGATAWAGTLTEPLKSKITAGLVTSALNLGLRNKDYPQSAEDAVKNAACFAWARELLTNTASTDLRRKLGPQLVRTLAASDPGAALTWAQENLHARPLAKAVTEVLPCLDSTKARAVVEQLPPGGVKQRAAFAAVGSPRAESVQWLMGQVKADAWDWGQVGAKWAFADATAFREFIAAQNPATLPKALAAAGIRNLVSKDAQGTLTWAAAFPDTGWASDALREWSREDPAASATWLKEHPGTSIKVDTVKALAGDYFRRAPGEAVAWAAALPSGSVRDSSVATMRQSLADSSAIKPETRTSLEAKLAAP